MVFIDYRKAFDSVKHTKIWEGMKNQEIINKVIRIIKNMYKKREAYKWKWIGRKKHWDPLSPNLFNWLLEEIFRKMD